MSSFTVASADEPENEPLPVADEQKKEKYDNEVITEGQKTEESKLLTEAQLKELEKAEEKEEKKEIETIRGRKKRIQEVKEEAEGIEEEETGKG